MVVRSRESPIPLPGQAINVLRRYPGACGRTGPILSGAGASIQLCPTRAMPDDIIVNMAAIAACRIGWGRRVGLDIDVAGPVLEFADGTTASRCIRINLAGKMH